MKVLYAASECDPFVKIGGLGDVIASLPIALLKSGVDVRTVIPFYSVVDRDKYDFFPVMDFDVAYGKRRYPVRLYRAQHPYYEGYRVYLLENEEFLKDGGDTAFAGTDEEVRIYSFFSQAVAAFVSHLVHWSMVEVRGEIWTPEIIHCHDWHTGIIPQIVRTSYGLEPYLARLKTVFTIHNLFYQGISPAELADALSEGMREAPLVKWDLANDDVDLLLQGIIGSDMVTTVSPSYAREIMTEEFGYGLEKVIKAREGRIRGILNGIDHDNWDPSTDPSIDRNYEVDDPFSLKKIIRSRMVNKKALQESLGLKVDTEVFLLGFVGRLEGDQKGLDLLEGLVNKMSRQDKFGDFQVVILGVGDEEWEDRLIEVGKGSSNVSVNIRFDDPLARKMFAGCDAIMMPSIFEPCGLPQMIAMRYGSVPIVRNVGGLKDSVEHGQNGFTFNDYTVESFFSVVMEAYEVFRGGNDWQVIVRNALESDFSWERSAREYRSVYQEVLGG